MTMAKKPAQDPPVMKLRFLGVRGSRPTHKRALLGYGGNSTSLEFVFPGEPFYLFLDGGSGLARRGQELGVNPDHNRFYVLVTHTHWDHILGYPFFRPIYSERNRFRFFASNTSRSTFDELFFGLQRAANLPVPMSQIKAKLSFNQVVPGVPFSLEDKVRIDTYQLNHQGVTLGYKVSYGPCSAAVITDNAPIGNGNHLGEGMRERAAADPARFEREFEAGLVAFLKDVHTVVFDTHFTEANLKADWGHSTPERALALAKRAGIKRLILFHHAPEDVDERVDDKVQSVFHEACHAGIEVEAAREGEEWDLSA
jgi:ribonuclease BN (tRNA processing enzyme)